jgi:glyoxylase I family protein
MFSKAHHVTLITKDYEKSKAFYTDILGLPIIRETYRAERQSYKLDLQLSDGLQLELFSFPNPSERPSRPEACGLRHFAFAVKGLDASVEHLKENGIEVEEIRVDELTGRRFTFRTAAVR